MECNHREAYRIAERILANIDEDQIREVISLAGTPPNLTAFKNLINLSEFLWFGKKLSFEFLAGIQFTSPFTVNVWLLSTKGIEGNTRFFLRELREARKYMAGRVNGRFAMTAMMPKWFTRGHRLAEHFGFERSGETESTYMYTGVLA